MNTSEAQQIVAVFVAAYPQSAADENTVALWINALQVADYDTARTAALEHVRTSNWWPTIAEFNGQMTTIRRDRARRANPSQITARVRCDGSGWFDRGNGLEPCPQCNPWLRAQFEEGDLHSAHRPAAPKDYVMPAPCRTVEFDSSVPSASGHRLALAAYLEACATEGRPPTQSIVNSFEQHTIPGIAVGI